MQLSDLEIAENEKGSSTIVGHARSEAPPLVSAVSDRLLHWFDYIAIQRPLLLIPGWTMLLMGYYKGISEESTTHIPLPLVGNIPVVLRPDSEILITLFLYSLLMGAVYIVNQISDSRTDEINGKLYLIAQGHMKKNRLKILVGIQLLVPVIIAFLRFPLAYAYLILLSIALGVLYSIPPVRLKGRPVLDLLVNALGFGFVAFAVGWISKSAFSTSLVLGCLPYIICVAAAFINTTIPDMKGDVQNGDATTGTFLGIRNSCIASTLLLATVPVVSLLLGDFVCLTASVLSLPFFIRMTVSNWDERSPNIPAITLATKVSLLVLSLMIAVLIPWYIVLLIPMILLVKWYHQTRFGISYP